MKREEAFSGLVVCLLLSWTGTVHASPTAQQKCEAAKLIAAGKYHLCRLKAEAKAIKTGNPVDVSRCDDKLVLKFGKAETRWGSECPTSGDVTGVQSQVTAAATGVALQLTGLRFVDNGDGTVTDTQTGLMWEQKDDSGGIHDTDNLYDWSVTNTFGDGAVFTDFLWTLNGGTSTDGNTITGCFANHCDWRLPTSVELQTILLEPYPCSTSPCADAILGPTQADGYWTSTLDNMVPFSVWVVNFEDGTVGINGTDFCPARAGRGGP